MSFAKIEADSHRGRKLTEIRSNNPMANPNPISIEFRTKRIMENEDVGAGLVLPLGATVATNERLVSVWHRHPR
jgi:hypothetical protein